MEVISPTTPAEGASPASTSETPAQMPDLSGMSQSELAGLLEKVNAGGAIPETPGPNAVTPPVKESEEIVNPYAMPKKAVAQMPKGGQPDLTSVLNKFGITPEQLQNNPGLAKLANSYYEAERNLSGHFQQVAELRKENEEIKRIASEYDEYIQQQKNQNNQPQSPANSAVNKDNIAWTPQQIEEFNNDPMGFMAREIKRGVQEGVKSELGNFQEKAHQDRILDNQILMEVSQARQNLDGFKYLEPEINKILGEGFIDKDPRAIKVAYHAALGARFPDLMREAQSKAFTEGYERHKADMAKHVESGGKSSLEIGGGGIDPDALAKLSIEEHAKLLPNNDFVRR